METVEIKIHKKRLAGIMALIVLIVIGTTILIIPAESHTPHYFIGFLYIGLNAFLIHCFYDLAKRLKSNTGMITLSPDVITVNDEGSDYSYNWKDVRSVAVSGDECTPCLTLLTIYEERKVSISWLDKSPAKIKELIRQYSDRAMTDNSERQ